MKDRELLELAAKAAIKACGCPEWGTVLDPFVRSGTTMVSALRTGRQAVGIELKPEYADFAAKRIRKEFGELARAKPQSTRRRRERAKEQPK